MNKYQGRVDPIDTLRSYITQHKKIKNKDGYLHFDNVKIKLTTETAWLSPITSQKYDIGALWLLLDCDANKVGLSDYIQKTTKYNLAIIPTADKPQILKYFKGEISQSTCINSQLKIQIIQKQMKKDKEDEQLMAQKKPKIQTQADMNLQVITWLKTFQRSITSKNRTLRTPQKSYEDVLKGLLNSGTQTKQDSKTNSKTKLALIFEKKKNPIIIVPNDQQPGNVDIKNIKSLLIDGTYVQSSKLPDTMVRKIEITYPIKDKNIVFDVTSNPSLLTPSDWSCVIAIFVAGRYSQFIGWHEANPVRIFEKNKGFLLKYPDSKVGEAGDWNIKVIAVNKMTRYQDIDVQRFIWTEIEKELGSMTNLS